MFLLLRQSTEALTRLIQWCKLWFLNPAWWGVITTQHGPFSVCYQCFCICFVHLTNYTVYITAADFFSWASFFAFEWFPGGKKKKILIVEAWNLSNTFWFRYRRHFLQKPEIEKKENRANYLSPLISNICKYIFTHLQYMFM